MTERQEHRYNDDTPSDRLVRFKWALTGEDSRAGVDRAEALYANVIIKLSDLLDAHGVKDTHQSSVILGGLVTSSFELSGGMEFDDWMTRLRLIPIRLLDKEVPPIESFTPQYICELFDTALPKDSVHKGDCLDFEYEGEACDRGPVCPARVVSRVCLRQLGFLVFDYHTYDPETALADIKRVDENIRALSYRLEQYGLFSKKVLEEVTDEMDKIAKDPYEAINPTEPPKHRRPD